MGVGELGLRAVRSRVAVHPTTYQTKPPLDRAHVGHVTSALCRSCLSFPRTSGIPGFQKNPVVGAHRQVCAPRGGGTRKRGHSGGQTKRSKAELTPFAESARKTAPFFLLLVPSLQVSAGASSALSDFFSAAHGVVSCAYRPLNCRLIDLGKQRSWVNLGPCM